MPDVPAPLDAFIEAVNTQDEQAFLDAFATDAFVDDGRVTVVGDWRSNHANGRSAFAFRTANGKITSMTIREG